MVGGASVSENLLWVECSLCNKWRVAPTPALYERYTSVDAVFQCSMWPGVSCNDPEDPRAGD